MDSTTKGGAAQGEDASAAPPKAEFVLLLKCISQLGWGLDDLGKAADEAGLVWSSVRTPESDKHIPGELKACPVATFEYGRSIRFSLGERQHEVRLRMDLQEHSFQSNALLVMRRAAETMARTLDAQVLLENGQVATDESLAPAQKWIRSVHEIRRQAARKLTTLPDGRVKEADPIIPWRAFIDGPQGGGRREWLDFDVEELGFWRGTARGQALMLELMKNLKSLTEPGRQGLCIGDALGEALGIDWRQAVRYRGKSRVNVASGMLIVVEEALRFFARNANFERWLESQIATSNRTADHFDAEDAVLREQRSVRAKLAHARKRQAATAPAEQPVPLAKESATAAAPAGGGGGRRVKRAAAQAVAA